MTGEFVCIAVFGSKVEKDGTPSGSLARRVNGAMALAESYDTPFFFVTGGTRHPDIPTEASVMTKLLVERGVSETRIIRDDASTDTLDSVMCAATNLTSFSQVIACSDRYHVIRISILLRMLSISARPGWILSGRSKTGNLRWIYMWLRDLIATFYDIFLLLSRKLTMKLG